MAALPHLRIAAIFVIGLLVRLIVAIQFWGSEDVTVQNHHGYLIRAGQPAWSSKLPVAYFLPPLMLSLAQATGFPEHAAQKLPAIAGDLIAALLLLRFATRDRRSARPWVWPAIYLLNPLTVMLSGYHGNVDPLMAAVMLWAIDLRRRNQSVSAGIAHGLAIAMKPTAVLGLAAVLLPVTRTSFLIAAAALLVPVALCLPFLLVSPRIGGFLSTYGGPYGEWGIPLILRQLDLNVASRLAFLPPWITGGLHATNDAMERYGRYFLAAVLAIWCLYALARWKNPMALEERARVLAATYLVFYVFAAGWGPQYLSLALPFLLIASLRLGVAYIGFLSPYLFVSYLCAWAFEKYAGERLVGRLDSLPRSDLFLLIALRGLTLLAWTASVWILFQLLRREKVTGTPPGPPSAG